ncbi:MAG TPA: hypothetical protein ACFYD6_05825 [Candidatus Brocadiia bacterium]|nr:hypothetical protein [Planctomycetota bacterium]MBI4007257.1 hypothetical protein [Planctomycetota bacterium]MDO8092005.1 hypothetical protein [Candidatus Brocadiales bacterium]
MVYILDTHTLVWFFEGSIKLGHHAVNILRDNTQRLIIPSIALTEIKYLSSKKENPSLFERSNWDFGKRPKMHDLSFGYKCHTTYACYLGHT